jgi:hypothetical protein
MRAVAPVLRARGLACAGAPASDPEAGCLGVRLVITWTGRRWCGLGTCDHRCHGMAAGRLLWLRPAPCALLVVYARQGSAHRPGPVAACGHSHVQSEKPEWRRYPVQCPASCFAVGCLLQMLHGRGPCVRCSLPTRAVQGRCRRGSGTASARRSCRCAPRAAARPSRPSMAARSRATRSA